MPRFGFWLDNLVDLAVKAAAAPFAHALAFEAGFVVRALARTRAVEAILTELTTLGARASLASCEGGFGRSPSGRSVATGR